MPKVRNLDHWAIAFREQVRQLGHGWTVRESPKSGRVMLKVRGETEEAVTLAFPWTASAAADAQARVRNIYKLVTGEGYSLKQAALVAAGQAPKLTEQQDWRGAVDRFKDQKLHHGTVIKPTTWEAKYVPVLTDAVALLTGRKPPTTPADLIDLCLRDPRWPPGSRTRQERARNLAQFLRYCVVREQFPPIWQPPADLKDHIGRKPADARSQKSDPITDQQIINLINSLPDDDAGRRWADAIRLLAELGLRPVELLHLSVRADPKTKELYWHCSYEKRAGGGVTKPRRLQEMPLRDEQGMQQQWDLKVRWKEERIDLPPLGMRNGAAESVANYLDRQSGWKSLRAQMESAGKRLTPYSFRHGYSLRCHSVGVIPIGDIALAMGHSLAVHCSSYPWAHEEGAAASFDRARTLAMTGTATS